jgi:hypothetical protein
LAYAISYALKKWIAIFAVVTAIAWVRTKAQIDTRDTNTSRSLDVMDKCVAYLLKTNTTTYSHFIKSGKQKNGAKTQQNYGFK